MPRTSQTYGGAYWQGRDDYAAGLPRTSCPFTVEYHVGAWRHGWDDARRAAVAAVAMEAA